MARITRFDKPAQANFVNTYVPVNMDLLYKGLANKQQNYLRGQQMLGQTESVLDNMEAIPNSPDDKYLRYAKATVKDLVNKYSSQDLSDPMIMNQFNNELRSKVNTDWLVRANKTFQGWQKGQQFKMQLGPNYNPLLDNDPAANWNSKDMGVYTMNPDWISYYTPRQKAVVPYLESLKIPHKLGIDEKTGAIQYGTSENDVREIANKNASEFASTHDGQNEIKLWRIAHPEDTRDPVDIARDILYEEGKKYIGVNREQFIPKYSTGSGSNLTRLPTGNYPVSISDNAQADTEKFRKVRKSVNKAQDKIKELEASGQTNTPEYYQLKAQVDEYNQQTQDLNNEIDKELEHTKRRYIADYAKQAVDKGYFDNMSSAMAYFNKYSDLSKELRGIIYNEDRHFLRSELASAITNLASGINNIFSSVSNLPNKLTTGTLKSIEKNYDKIFGKNGDKFVNANTEKRRQMIEKAINSFTAMREASKAPYSKSGDFNLQGLTLNFWNDLNKESKALERTFTKRGREDIAKNMSFTSSPQTNVNVIHLASNGVNNASYVDGAGKPISGAAELDLFNNLSKLNVLNKGDFKKEELENISTNTYNVSDISLISNPGGTRRNGVLDYSSILEYKATPKNDNTKTKTIRVKLTPEDSNYIYGLYNQQLLNSNYNIASSIYVNDIERIPDVVWSWDDKQLPQFVIPIRYDNVPYVDKDTNEQTFMTMSKEDDGKYHLYYTYGNPSAPTNELYRPDVTPIGTFSSKRELVTAVSTQLSSLYGGFIPIVLNEEYKKAQEQQQQ